ncbi:MAG: ammonium transporter [Acidimicrobiales bacterium]
MRYNSGDTAWVLVSAALVLFMTPGLAFFYAGMVRRKNVLAMLMQNFVTMAVVGLLWVWLTYSLAFGPDWGGIGILGTLHFAGLGHMQQAVPGYHGPTAMTIPPVVFVAFQMTFAVITAALLTGSVADRLRFPAFVVFIALWGIVVYAPIAHWVFSPTGWLARGGTEDFAGGTVVELTSGISGATLAWVVGRRRGWPRELMRPHSVPLSVLGAGILWFGWFGFNAGSALQAGHAGNALINTNTATAAALLAWIVVERLRDGKPTTLGAASGAVAGAVAITPACGFVNTLGATVIGAVAGVLCALAVGLKFRLRVDDSLDVFAVHGVGGLTGLVLLGFFGTSSIGGVDGVFYGGGATLLGHELLAIVSVGAYAFGATAVVALAVKLVTGLRVGGDDEETGLDLSQHEESAYDLEIAPGGTQSQRGGSRPPRGGP